MTRVHFMGVGAFLFLFSLSGVKEANAEQGLASAADTTISKSIFKLDKKRYEKFSNSKGTVFLPSLGLSFDESAKNFLCEGQLKSIAEVLKVMDSTLNADDQRNMAVIQQLIGRCAKGDFAVTEATKKEDSTLNVKVTPPSPVDASKAAAGDPAQTPAVSVGKTWK